MRVPTRFRGFSPKTREFFAARAADPCSHSWPGEERMMYAAFVLAPLKTLAKDLHDELLDDPTPLAVEPRVGRSLFWECPSQLDECPVHLLRVWRGNLPPEESPWLIVSLSCDGLEVGVTSGTSQEARERMHANLLRSSDFQGTALRLVASGWEVAGADGSLQTGTDAVPVTLHPWFVAEPFRLTRRLLWEEWVDEPGLIYEVADLFRDVLPVFEALCDRPRIAEILPPQSSSPP